MKSMKKTKAQMAYDKIDETEKAEIERDDKLIATLKKDVPKNKVFKFLSHFYPVSKYSQDRLRSAMIQLGLSIVEIHKRQVQVVAQINRYGLMFEGQQMVREMKAADEKKQQENDPAFS